MKTLCILGSVALLLAATGASAATDKDKPQAKHDCFFTRDWDGWSAPGDGDTLYLRVKSHDIYRLDLVPGSHVRKDPDNFLINRQRGSDWVCSPLDLDLTLSDHSGFRAPVLIKSLRKLTPEEAAAIPPKDRP